MDKKQAIINAIKADFKKANKRDPKDDKELAQFVQKQGGEKYVQKKAQEVVSPQTAAHGAKLNYFKSLKNQCAEDEEVVYFRAGGSVGCGCKKKEDRGEVAKAQKGTAIDKFKNRKKEVKQDQATRDSIRINSSKGDDELEATRPGNYKPNPKHNPKDPNSKTHIWVPDRTKAPYNKKAEKKACGSKIKKHQEGSVIAKFKMHRQGGSLNGIPFIRMVQ